MPLSACAERSFNLFLPALAQRRGGLVLFSPALAQRRGGLLLACTRSKSRRTFSCLHSLKVEEDFLLPALAQSRGGLFLLLACAGSKARRSFSLTRLHSLKGEEVFFFSCLKTHESVEVFSHHWCLRSPKDDEDFKTLTAAANCRKTMGTLKLLTDVANHRKTMGT